LGKSQEAYQGIVIVGGVKLKEPKVRIRKLTLCGSFLGTVVEVDGKRAIPGNSRWEIKGKPVSASLDALIERKLKEFYKKEGEKMELKLIVFEDQDQEFFEKYRFFKRVRDSFEAVLVRTYEGKIDYSIAFFPHYDRDSREVLRCLVEQGHTVKK